MHAAASDITLIDKLIPVLSKKEKEEIKSYFLCSEKYEKSLAEEFRVELVKHPVFGPLMKSMPKDVQEANNKISKQFQKEAIFNDKWKELIEYQIQQGITYAKMGLHFKSWYDIIIMARNYLTPCFYKEYGGTDKFLGALNGMNLYFDISMGIIGEAYLAEKKQIIREDAEEIEKLNRDLERKVIERTAKLEESISKLKESEEKFEKAFHASAAGVSITRLADGVLVDVNDAFAKMTGYTFEELIGHSTVELGLVMNIEHRDDILEQIKKKGGAKDFEMHVKRKDGKEITVLSSTESILMKGEKFAINILYDITYRKEAEEQLKAVNKELESFSYSVSHDLRAPLRAIDGYTKMLDEDYNAVFDSEGKRFLEMIQYNAKKMSSLIDDLLAFSRLGRKELQVSQLNMNDLVEGAIIDLNKTYKHNCTITVGNLHPAMGDYALINQVMVNLISNGVKYSSKKDKPSVTISSEVNYSDVIYTVKDNGDGFDMRYVHKLFGVFQRLHSSEEFEGTGVGLAIVKRIITKHGGKVWAEAEKGKGATLSFTLPNQ